jgi:hypothetical protein
MPSHPFSSTKQTRRRVLRPIERAALARTLGSVAEVAARWEVSPATVKRIRRVFRLQYIVRAALDAPTLTPIGNLNDLLERVQ